MHKSKSDNISQLSGVVPYDYQYDALRQFEDCREHFNKKPSKIRRFNFKSEQPNGMMRFHSAARDQNNLNLAGSIQRQNSHKYKRDHKKLSSNMINPS